MSIVHTQHNSVKLSLLQNIIVNQIIDTDDYKQVSELIKSDEKISEFLSDLILEKNFETVLPDAFGLYSKLKTAGTLLYGECINPRSVFSKNNLEPIADEGGDNYCEDYNQHHCDVRLIATHLMQLKTKSIFKDPFYQTLNEILCQ